MARLGKTGRLISDTFGYPEGYDESVIQNVRLFFERTSYLRQFGMHPAAFICRVDLSRSVRYPEDNN